MSRSWGLVRRRAVGLRKFHVGSAWKAHCLVPCAAANLQRGPIGAGLGVFEEFARPHAQIRVSRGVPAQKFGHRLHGSFGRR